MTGIASVLRGVLDTVRVACGACVYLLTDSTPGWAYQALIRLFCRTGGKSNDLLARGIRAFDPGPRLPRPQGQLGVSDSEESKRVAARLRADGYFVFEKRLSDAVCDRLVRFAVETPARIRPMTGQSPAAAAAEQRARYDRAAPSAVRYDFDAADLLGLPDVQQLLADPALLSVARDYLGTTPIADVVAMWWHTAYSQQPDEDAAQFYHFDMDRIQWLKFFVYLTDVGEANGAHCFIRGSHRTGGIPAEILARGYARLTDDEVLRHYGRDRVVEVLAPRGTIIAEDTRGLHKGREVLSGDRLMLQLQFSDSLFGGSYPRARRRAVSPELVQMSRLFPKIYRNCFGESP
jgi:ectoine hydroxylase-related dioxygenase (phytanoyl-CoA dioxygenase family)